MKGIMARVTLWTFVDGVDIPLCPFSPLRPPESSRYVAHPGGLRFHRGRSACLLNEALPIALDPLQMRIHKIHRLDRIAAGDRIEDALMLGMRLAAAIGALKIDAAPLGGHQV